jgi:AcrR family transcriptional regulator
MVIAMSAAVHPESTGKQRGRPRSAVRHHAILDSTRGLLAAGPYEQLTIEAIAAQAGVSKQTIYKWWPSKAAVVTEAVISGYLSVADVPPADTGDISADLRSWLRARCDELEDPAAVALVRAMTAATAEGTDAERIYDRLAVPHRQYVLQRLTAASRQGQLRPGADLEAAVDAILGFVLFQTLSRGKPATHERAEGLVDILLEGMTSTIGVHAQR